MREVRTRLVAEGFADPDGRGVRAGARSDAARAREWRSSTPSSSPPASCSSGRLAEMATGEGKTLAAALTAATAALAGMPVHVMTSNDYLVDRDAEHARARSTARWG